MKTNKLDSLYYREKIINDFKINNVNSDSIMLEGSSPRKELLSSYNKVDIALDPFPYSGGITSFESIWMGVPVLTKKGSKFVSHTTASINRNSGMSDWIAKDEDEYLAKTIQFTSNLRQLDQIRMNLRKKVLSSPSFNASLFAEHFRDNMWQIWKKYINKNN